MPLKTLVTFSDALAGLLAKRLGRPMLCRMCRIARQHRQRKTDMATLRNMSDRELNDLGIGRGDIPALLDEPALWRRDRR